MFANLLIGLREGLEAALIISILLAAVRKLGRADLAGRIWFGAGLAALLSAAIGFGLGATTGALPEPAEQIFAGSTSLIAVALLTWMIFWMASRSRMLKGQLERSVESALFKPAALASVAFVAVLREGVETALFLWAGITATSQGTDSSGLVGAGLGLALAATLGVAIYRGALRINLSLLFRVSGYALVLVAAGVLTYAVHEFQEIGWLPGAGVYAYDISAVLPADSVVATVLRGLLNFRPMATWLEVATWWIYVLPTFARLLRQPAATAPAVAKV